MSGWEKLKIITGVVATVLIPVVVVLVGQEYSRSAKEREIGAKYVELAIGVLRSPPADQAYNIRDWAVTVVDRHSGVPLTPAQREDLIRTGVLRDVAIGPAVMPVVQLPAEARAAGEPRAPDDRVTVPNVRGLTAREAQEAFSRAGLSAPPELREQPDTSVVSVQSPPAGSSVPRGTQTQVTIAGRASVPADRLSRQFMVRP